MQEDAQKGGIHRRSFIASLTGGCALAGLWTLGLSGCAGTHSGQGAAFPPLPYAQNALEPFISGKTVEFHYGRHHKGYVDKTNELAKAAGLSALTLEELTRKSAGSADKTALFNNAAQAWNHDFYWKSLKPGGSKPGERLIKMIDASFGSFENFRKEFADAAVGQFGSGWAWLVLEKNRLAVMKTSNADNPLIHGKIPLLTIDVWEHAYYLDYQNRRGDYVNALIDNLLNWEFAASNLPKAG